MKRTEIREQITRLFKGVVIEDKVKEVLIESIVAEVVKTGLLAYDAGKDAEKRVFDLEEITDIDKYVGQLYFEFVEKYIETESWELDQNYLCIEVISKAFRAGYRKRLNQDLANNLRLLSTTFGGVFEPVQEMKKPRVHTRLRICKKCRHLYKYRTFGN